MPDALPALLIVFATATVAFGVVAFLLILPPSSAPSDDLRDAERRWTERNAAARAAGCPCGQPATEVRYNHGNLGSVPIEMWTCSEHADVELWYGAQPLWSHKRQLDGVKCWGSIGPNGGPATEWYYPVRPSAVATR